MLPFFNIMQQNNCILFIQDDLDVNIQDEVSHYFLQQALAYLQIEETIRYSATGKPYLQDSFVYFNVSHSNHIWVAAFSFSNIGVDVEVLSNSTLIANLDESLGIESIKDWCASEAIIKCLDIDLDEMMHIKKINLHTLYQYKLSKLHTYCISDSNIYEGFIASETDLITIHVVKNKLGLQNNKI
jgi:phosphopantetheinyl transferase